MVFKRASAVASLNNVAIEESIFVGFRTESGKYSRSLSAKCKELFCALSSRWLTKPVGSPCNVNSPSGKGTRDVTERKRSDFQFGGSLSSSRHEGASDGVETKRVERGAPIRAVICLLFIHYRKICAIEMF